MAQNTWPEPSSSQVQAQLMALSTKTAAPGTAAGCKAVSWAPAKDHEPAVHQLLLDDMKDT